jgi:HAD superfamily hydrolase (TIGR01484 family)
LEQRDNGMPGRKETFPLQILEGGRIVKQLIVFDLDGTLAESKSPLDAGMAALLHALLGTAQVAVISGGDWPQFEKQLLSNLPEDERLVNLSLLPTCGTKFFQYTGAWKKIYSEDFTADEKERIITALKQALGVADFTVEKLWGETIEDRGSQITFSALGQQAPLEEKNKWDPDFSKRKTIKSILDPLLPGFSVRIGGATSIDVTKSGIDKAYGIQKLRDLLGIPLQDMIFIGDALFPGGNDFPVKATGVVCISVRGPMETKVVTEAIIACLDHSPHSQPADANSICAFGFAAGLKPQ